MPQIWIVATVEDVVLQVDQQILVLPFHKDVGLLAVEELGNFIDLELFQRAQARI